MTMPHNNSNKAVGIARRAIPFMSDNNIPITPRNYFVWYEYFYGNMQELKDTLDELINAKANFDEKLNSKIYTRFFSRSLSDEQERKLMQEMKTVEEVNATAGKILEPIKRELHGASKNTENYGEKLKEMAGKIQDEKDVDSVHAIMMTLVKETEKRADENRAFSSGLKNSTQQLEDLKQKLAQAKAEARLDDLTKIQNRRAFNEKIVQITQAVNDDNLSAALAIVDIDKFKRINDTYGHPVGDKALISIAGQLVDHATDGDEVFRVGGEEFATILSNCSLEKAIERMDLVRDSIASHQFTIRNVDETITISVGISQIEKGASPDEVEKLADAALYMAKESGRNNVKTSVDMKAQDVTGA